jgi:hypothetical protein
MLGILVVAIALLVYSFAYMYQYVWPKKPLLVDTDRKPPRIFYKPVGHRTGAY